MRGRFQETVLFLTLDKIGHRRSKLGLRTRRASEAVESVLVYPSYADLRVSPLLSFSGKSSRGAEAVRPIREDSALPSAAASSF
ncbi:hypothetical protein EBE87_25495 [Pseudoroseomonas wenyumeiae]|uniref:Uncharacterized protein n=1 Tax=Teichococcus wenyumeiae TaxID=2478470 RepID=A0A3A9JEJ8_9PROT|nr:hypothetical protein D6Z83_16895 [Pseudoroseomonas wenyumeiae]RMI15507.1 hypothetical protein EBE87_25495 [Pseudoroseomonas wenyumeiae]